MDSTLTAMATADRVGAMGLLVLLLLGGIVALWASNRALLRRVERIERRLGAAGMKADADAAPGASPTAPPPPVGDTFGDLFERFVAGRVLIWLGGIALIAAALFLIRFSIEIGLVTPAARMIAAALFGAALLGAGEYARGHRLFADDPRIAQALVGAGVAVLYATAYASYILYGLIGPGAVLAAMVAITAGALALSLRHGAPTALIGLAGGFVTPLLVGDPDAGALPLLGYVALLDAAVFALAARRGWAWLAALAVALSFAWTAFFIFGAAPDALVAGGFVLVLAVAVTLLRPGRGRVVTLVQPLVVGLVELAALAARADVEPAAWMLFGLLAAASLVLAGVKPDLRQAPGAGLALALLVLLGKAVTGLTPILPAAAAGTTALFAAGGAALVLRRTAPGLAIAAAALAGPLLILRLCQPMLLLRPAWGGIAALLALGALGLLGFGRRAGDRDAARASLFAGAVAALLLAMAAADLAPGNMVSIAWLALALALLLVGMRISDTPLRLAGLALLTVTACKVFLIDAARLEGIWRVLSFFGLGIALIGIGRLYGPLLRGKMSGADGSQRE